MGTIIAQTIINDVGRQLNDPGFVRWSDDDIFSFLNNGQRLIASLKQDVYVRAASRQLAAGPLQTLPEDGIRLVTVVCNMNGGSHGAGIDEADLKQKRRFNPGFLTAEADITVREFYRIPGDPKRYYVWPPQPTPPGSVLEHYSAVPPDIDGKTSPIVIDDIYRDALFFYALARAYAVDTAEGSDEKSSRYDERFLAVLAGKNNAEAEIEAEAESPT